MAETRAPRSASAQLLPTLFDRLRDDAPQRHSERPDAYTVTPAQMRRIIERDLAYLLNTTNCPLALDVERYPAVASSTLNYGVAPVAGGYLSAHKWHDLVGNIRRAILDFEPRMIPDSLVVTPLRTDDAPPHRYNVLRIEIRGLIHMDPYPMAFTAQSSLDLDTSRIALQSVDPA